MQGKHSADYEDGFWDALEKYENLISKVAIMRDDDDDIQDYVRPWRGLTDEERRFVRKWTEYNQFMSAAEYAELVQKATEAKLKEKNHG